MDGKNTKEDAEPHVGFVVATFGAMQNVTDLNTIVTTEMLAGNADKLATSARINNKSRY